MRRIVATIGKYDIYFESEEVDSIKKIESLLQKKVIDSPGMLINAVIANNYYTKKISKSKQAEALEKKLNSEFSKIKTCYYDANNLLEIENVDWKKVNNDLLVQALKDFSKYL